MVTNLILPNDVVLEHFARENNIPSTYSRDGATLEQKLFELSHYQQVRLGNIIRAGFGGVANIPSKAEVFLVTDYEARESNDIEGRVRNLLQTIVRGRVRPPEKGIIEEYFDDAILQLTQFSGKENRREEMPTELAESDSIQIGWKYIPLYSKTWDGFLVGDPFAYLGIISSTIEGARSGKMIWGQANSRGSTNAQEMRILILYWLLKREGGEGEDKDFIKEVFEYKGRIHEGGKIVPEIGWHDTIAENKGKVTYSMLDQIVRPDLRALWQYRQDNLDTALRSQEGYNKFVQQAREARMKHIEDRLASVK